jgi:lauroyl/myristoyl acyltransferase
VSLRHLLSWKPLFFDVLLPALRRLGPARCDAALGGLGRLLAAWPPRGRVLASALERAGRALGADWDPTTTRTALAANIPRFLARDCPLDGAPDAEVFARFDVRGAEHLDAALAAGRGAILLGGHLGAYLAAVHWLDRRGVPLRLFVQRPRHVSGELQRRFDRDDGPHPQAGLFLRRGLSPAEAADRILRARAALRDGHAVYLCGDIPWASGNARPGRLLGHRRRFLAVWADLAVLARAPVVPLFCTHRPGGRFALTIDPPWSLSPGSEDAAVARYLERLEAEIAAHPADAVAHLLWPGYGPPPSVGSPSLPNSRTRRRPGPHPLMGTVGSERYTGTRGAPDVAPGSPAVQDRPPHG